MSDENKLVDITKVILDKFTENELTRFESLFILEAVRSSLQEQIITETIKEMYSSKNQPSPGIG
jgi:hypothetical protein|tara:strand:+ start:105 stop:296 length:192 start_codon:yes stop_codon:yes gene_type:complete